MWPRLGRFPRRVVLTCVYLYCLLFVHRFYDARQTQEAQALKKDWLDQEFASRAAQVKAGCAAHPPPLTMLQKHARDATNVSISLVHHFQDLHLKDVLTNLLYVPRYNFTWCLVPKVASSSWSSALLDLERHTRDDYVSSQVVFRQKFKMKNIQHINQTISQSLKFLFVRHPFERLVSAYRNKLEDSYINEDGEYFYKNYGLKIVSKFRGNTFKGKPKKTAITADEGEENVPVNRISEDRKVSEPEEQDDNNNEEFRREPTFQEYVDYLINTAPHQYDEHWKPVSLQCHVCEFDFDYIIKYENFKEEIDYFVQLLQEKKILPQDLELKWKNRGGTDHEATAKYLSTISENKLWKLYDKYRLDFVYFGYTMDGYIKQS